MRVKLLSFLGVLSLLIGASVFQAMLRREDPADRVSRAEIEALRAELARIASLTNGQTSSGDVAAEPAEPRLDATQLLELRSEIDALQRQVARLQREVGAQDPAGEMEPVRSAPRAQPDLSTYLDDVIEEEAAAADTSRLAAELRPSIVRALPRGASLRDLVCRSSLCRAEISYPDLDAFQAFVEEKLSGSDGAIWKGPTFLELLTEPGSSRGDALALVYLGREAGAFAPVGAEAY